MYEKEINKIPTVTYQVYLPRLIVQLYVIDMCICESMCVYVYFLYILNKVKMIPSFQQRGCL